MPIHLPPSDPPTRRRFLQWSALAGGAASLPAFAPASRAADEPERWAFLSDTHIDADPAFVSKQGVCMAENLKRVVAEVLAETEKVDAVFIDGDCAYLDGQRGDYDVLAELLAPLREAGIPIHMTMGNHDDRDVFAEAFGAHRPDAPPVKGKRVSVAEGREVDWIFLDSLRFVNQVEGEFGPVQLAWLEDRLKAPEGKPAILVGHHNIQVVPAETGPGEKQARITGLVDSGDFLALASRLPRVKAYIYGHSHDWKTATDTDGLHQINLPPTAYVFNPARPNGWVRATVSAGGIAMELRALDPAHPEHGKTVELKWR